MLRWTTAGLFVVIAVNMARGQRAASLTALSAYCLLLLLIDRDLSVNDEDYHINIYEEFNLVPNDKWEMLPVARMRNFLAFTELRRNYV